MGAQKGYHHVSDQYAKKPPEEGQKVCARIFVYIQHVHIRQNMQ